MTPLRNISYNLSYLMRIGIKNTIRRTMATGTGTDTNTNKDTERFKESPLKVLINDSTINIKHPIKKPPVEDISVDSEESPLKELTNESSVNYEDDVDEWASPPYPSHPLWDAVEDEGIDPKDTSIIMFPGQGTQYLGMGQDLQKFPRARDLYKIAKEVTGVDLLKINDLRVLDKHAQLAIVVNSLAALEKLREERPSAISSCVATAGFSLGEITSLIFAGAIPYEQGLKLVTIRAAAMEAASIENPGGMVTVQYGADTNIRIVCKIVANEAIKMGEKNAICRISTFLFPQCVVLSATKKALQYLTENNRKLGVRRMKRLEVSGPFHTNAMQSAVAPFSSALELCDIENPKIRVISSASGKQYNSSQMILKLLPRQIIQPVKWQQLLQSLYLRKKGLDFPKTYEVGPGNTLRTTLRLVNAAAWDFSISING